MDIALWDILGKLLEVPIYKLLGGGARNRIRLYEFVGGNTPEAAAKSVERVKGAGFNVLRLGYNINLERKPDSVPDMRIRELKRPWDLKHGVNIVKWIREAGGDDVDIIVFGHSHEPFNQTISGVLMVNPGSPTVRASAPWPSYGIIDIGEAVHARIIRLM